MSSITVFDCQSQNHFQTDHLSNKYQKVVNCSLSIGSLSVFLETTNAMKIRQRITTKLEQNVSALSASSPSRVFKVIIIRFTEIVITFLIDLTKYSTAAS